MLENSNNNLNENQENEVTETKPEEIIETCFKETNIDNQNKENQGEEIPVIIYEKKQDYANFGSRYYGNSSENNYNNLVQTFTQTEEKQVYKWSLEDEENRLTAKKIKKAQKNLGLKIFAGAMSLMFAFSAILSGGLLINHLNGSAYTSSGNNFEQMAITVPKVDENEAEKLTVKEVIEKIKPSVVCIEAEVEVTSGFWGRGGTPYTETGVGTGFILTEDGYIATNYHVIENAKKITVLMDNGKSYSATLIGGDEAADLAVIKIDGKNLPVAELGNSDTTEEGEFVVAIGSPGGVEFAGSSTFGIISAINRNIEVSTGRKMTLLQTDAAINPGNSGGPLVNMQGQVIGINTLKLASTFSTNYEGMGFAIPIKSAVDTFNNIIANPGITAAEYIPGAYNENDKSSVSFGISGGTITESEAALYEIPQGVLVSEVNPVGACGKAGIQAYDIITALDGETVKSMDELVELKNKYKAGDKAVVTVDRNGEKLDFTITFDARETD